MSSPITVITSTFLHGDIFHLAGNMLFLWVFGPAVEDRLRIPGYLGLYALTGFAGSVAHVMLGSVSGVPIPTLGASGCIMGVLGAYWYIFPWSKVCVAYFFWLFIFKIWYGVFEVAAVWVIGFYFASDLFWGCFHKAAAAGGGVANFAHVGGAFTGALLVGLLKVKRDSAEVSTVKAAQADYKDINLLSCSELKQLLSANLEDEDLVVKLASKGAESGTAEDIKFAVEVNRRTVLNQCPQALVHYMLVMQGSPSALEPGDILCLARWCEQKGRSDQALCLYQLVRTHYSDSREVEMALLRSAYIQWNNRHDSRQALADLDQLLTKFPAGQTMFEAEDLRDSILQATGQLRSNAA